MKCIAKGKLLSIDKTISKNNCTILKISVVQYEFINITQNHKQYKQHIHNFFVFEGTKIYQELLDNIDKLKRNNFIYISHLYVYEYIKDKLRNKENIFVLEDIANEFHLNKS